MEQDDLKSRMMNGLPSQQKADTDALVNFRKQYEEYRKRANDNPAIKEGGIILPELKKRHGIFYKVILIAIVVIIAAALGGLLYLAYIGKFQSVMQSLHVCGNVSLSCGALTCEKQICTPPSNNFTCNPIINLACGNQT